MEYLDIRKPGVGISDRVRGGDFPERDAFEIMYAGNWHSQPFKRLWRYGVFHCPLAAIDVLIVEHDL